MSTRTLTRTLLVALCLSAPFPFAARAGEKLVAPLSAGSVRMLLRVTAPLLPAPPTPELEAPELEAPELELSAPEAAPLEAVATGKVPRQRARQPVLQAPSALFVSQATVLRLAESSARPRGSFVSQTGEHPAGLRLAEVAGLGIGVQDGDILIEALGITPRSPGQVIGAIIEARAQKARALSGTLWRRGQTFKIVVEQPY